MNVYVPKNRVTLRHSGQRPDFPKNYICNITTFGPNVAMWQRGLPFNVSTLVVERHFFNVVMFLRGIFSTSRH